MEHLEGQRPGAALKPAPERGGGAAWEPAVRPEKLAALRARLAALGLAEADLREEFLAAGTVGGQHANRKATGVRLRHGPSGAEVVCRDGRSQALNRFLARRLLADKVDLLKNGAASEAARRVARIRKQKARASRRRRAQEP